MSYTGILWGDAPFSDARWVPSSTRRMASSRPYCVIGADLSWKAPPGYVQGRPLEWKAPWLLHAGPTSGVEGALGHGMDVAV